MKIAVMDGHRQGKKANAYKYPLTFLKWWSSLILKTFTVPAESLKTTVLQNKKFDKQMLRIIKLNKRIKPLSYILSNIQNI